MTKKHTIILIFNILFLDCIFSQIKKLDFSSSFDSEIIAFGEASHGDKTVYNARRYIINQLKKTHNKINVLVEMPQGVTYILDDFLRGRIDSLYFLKELQLYGLQTNSFLEFIDTYKLDSNVTFYGIDMQHHRLSIQKIISQFESNISKEELKKTGVLEKLNSLNISFNKKLQSASNVETFKKEINENLFSIERFVNEHKEDLNKSHEYWLNIILPLRIVNQSYNLAIINLESPYKYDRYRDSCMASNTILIQSKTKVKTLILAANRHVSKENGSMGGFLNQYYNDKYHSICTQYYSGKILIVKKSLKFGVETVELTKFKGGLPNKINKLYNREGYKCAYELYIENKKFKKQKIINKNCYIQDIGAYFNVKYKKSGYSYGKPSLLYDAIYFNYNAEPSVRLIKR